MNIGHTKRPAQQKLIKGEIVMGIEGWYMADDYQTDSSYTDFTQSNYVEFNKITVDEPVKRRHARTHTAGKPEAKKAAVKPAKVRIIREKTPKVKAPKVKATKIKAPKVKKVKVKTPKIKAVKAAPKKEKRKGRAGKAVLCTFAALTLVAASCAGTWYYLTDIKGYSGPKKASALEVELKTVTAEFFAGVEGVEVEDSSIQELKRDTDKTAQKSGNSDSYSKSSPAYQAAEDVMASLWRDNDVDTAWEIFNWVHSNISYQTVTQDLDFEDAAFRGFSRRSGDCYVYFACAKMLLDVAGIPNMMVERYPVITNGHFWNLVQLNGEWYHCDATVFRDHPDMYFMCTDDEIADDHHEFNHDLYPERASGYSDYWGAPVFMPGEEGEFMYDDYDDFYDEDYNEYYEEDYSEWYEEDYYEDWDSQDFYYEEW